MEAYLAEQTQDVKVLQRVFSLENKFNLLIISELFKIISS